MRQTKRSTTFLMTLLINCMLNFEWSIPAWILLALHYWKHISIKWFIGALALWIVWNLIWMLIIWWANKSSTPDEPKENKNPYSKSNKQIFK